MRQNLTLEANRFSPNNQIALILLNRKVYNRIQNYPPTSPPKQAQSFPSLHITVLKGTFYIILTSFLQVVTLPRVSSPKPCRHHSCLHYVPHDPRNSGSR